MLVSAAFISQASAAELNVNSNLFGSTANVIVRDGDQPVTTGSVVIKDQHGNVAAQGDLNSKGRANLRMMSVGYGEYTVLAKSGELKGSSHLIIDDRQTAH